MSDGYTKYTGNPAGGANTNPKPGSGYPVVLIPADGYVPTSAMFQQFEQTLADWTAYGSVQLSDGYGTMKSLMVDGIGNQTNTQAAGDGYIKHNLLVGNSIISNGSMGATTTFSVGGSSTFVGGSQFIGSIDASINGIKTNTTGTSAPLSGYVFADMLNIAWANCSVTGTTLTVNRERGVSVTRGSAGIYVCTLQTASTGTTNYVVNPCINNADNTSASIVKVVNTSASSFTIQMTDTSFTPKDSNFSFTVVGLI